MSDGLIETYRGGIPAWECDIFGHLNIAFYGERFDDAAQDLLERHAAGQGWRSRSMDTQYLHELRAGEGLAIRSAIIDGADGVVRLGHEAINSATGARTTRVAQRLYNAQATPAELARLAAAAVPWTDADFAPLDLPVGAGTIASGRDRVKPWEADASGCLALLGFLHRFSTACLHVLDAIGMTDAYRRQAGRGFATFETRLVIEAPPRLGDGVVLDSAVIDAGTSSLRMLHRMSAARSGQPLAHFYQAGVHFDLEARRSAPFPAALRERALVLRVAAAR
jgi:acyl-CoA thioesterase FadM